MFKGRLEASGIIASRQIAQREWRRLMKRGLRIMLRWWHKRYLPRHFAAARVVTHRYPGVYAPRSPKYQARKRRVKGHSKLLVWSGETERAVLGRPRLGGTGTQAWIEVVFPNRAQKSRGGKWTSAPLGQTKRELTAVSRSEHRELVKRLEGWVVKQIPKVKGTRRRRAAA